MGLGVHGVGDHWGGIPLGWDSMGWVVGFPEVGFGWVCRFPGC